MKRLCAASAMLVLLLVTSTASAQQQDPFELTVANIMRGPEHVGEPPSRVRWSDSGEWIYFFWKPGGTDWHEESALHRVRARGGEPERLEDAVADSLAPLLANGDVSRDKRWRVVSSDGDLYLIERRNDRVRRLTQTTARETSPVFSADARTVYYLSEGPAGSNILAIDLDRGGIRQLTDIRGPAPREPQPATGQRGFLEQQQEELFEHIRRARARRETQEARREAREARQLTPIHLQREERVRSLAVEPRGSYAIIEVFKPSDDARRTLIPDWVTASGYTETREMRTKVGDNTPTNSRLGVVALDDGSVEWLNLARATGDTTRTFASAGFLGWNNQGTAGLVAAMDYEFENAWLWSIDAATGALTLLRHDTDEAWLGGPCAFWFNCAGFLPDGRTAWFVSEESGFSHLYTVPVNGGSARQLTSGNWEVQGVQVAPTEDRFYLTTNEGTPHEVHFYHMPLNGGERTRITSERGKQDVTASPDGRRIAVVHSFANVPPELYVGENRARASLARVTTSPTAEWRAGPWIVPEIIHIGARDGVQVPARIYTPEEFGATPNGAAVIFVHGAGYLQNVHDWWSTYYREYMFHHLLAQRGFVVLDVDYRASSGYGRDWRTAIFRHMGGTDLTDQVDASRWLQQQRNIHPERIGIYGGSYGGFITLMALFTAAEDFGAGAALRSVTDWAHYNHGYTGRILNLPQDDSVAYRQSSPIYFAEGLEDPLLMAHGMVDVNVHFSDIVRLTQRLIELGKTDWELAVYPVEDHGFVEPSSWTDEYLRILKLFEEQLTAARTTAAERAGS